MDAVTWIDLVRYGKQWLFGTTPPSNFVCLSLNGVQQRDFVTNNLWFGPGDKGKDFAYHRQTIPLSYSVKFDFSNSRIAKPENIEFKEEARIIKTAHGYITNTLVGTSLILSKSFEKQEYYRVTSVGGHSLGSTDVLKVHEAGIFWYV